MHFYIIFLHKKLQNVTKLIPSKVQKFSIHLLNPFSKKNLQSVFLRRNPHPLPLKKLLQHEKKTWKKPSFSDSDLSAAFFASQFTRSHAGVAMCCPCCVHMHALKGSYVNTKASARARSRARGHFRVRLTWPCRLSSRVGGISGPYYYTTRDPQLPTFLMIPRWECRSRFGTLPNTCTNRSLFLTEQHLLKSPKLHIQQNKYNNGGRSMETWPICSFN